MSTTFDLSTLGLSAGTHSITVKARASGYEDSDESNAVSYTVGTQEITITSTSGDTIYTMPSGYSFARLVSSEYNTNGIFALNDVGQVIYDGSVLFYLDDTDTLVEAVATMMARGTFYWQKQTYTLSGTWLFNEVLSLPSYTINSKDIKGTLGSGDYIYSLQAQTDGLYTSITGKTDIYNPTNGWEKEAYRTITFDGTRIESKEFYEWFTANATMLSGGSND